MTRPARARFAALLTGVAVTVGACVVPAPDSPDDLVTSLSLPEPGNASQIPQNTPLPADVTMCPASPLPSALPPPGQMPAGSTMARILQRGRLIVGIDIGSNLLAYRDPITGTINGFDVSIARQIAQAIFGDDTHIQFQILAGDDDRVSALQSGAVDIVVKTMAATCDRAKDIAFSATYYLANQRVLTPRSQPVNTVGDLSGRRVCEMRGTTSLVRIRRAVPSARVIAVDSWPDCLVLLQQGQADAVSSDDAVLAGLVSQDPNVTITGPVLGQDPYAVGVGKQNVDLVRFVNAVLLQIERDGTWMQLYNQWFGATLGPVWSPPAATYTSAP
ncbi:glutamate ABC transporter substrate-binding protein [Tsukamurella soli]|uniref:Glutamate ABC transporter substrate-binding protein n=1 Tax=Tsukamurella soli TaxID=644556 RepID=A0ABP8JCA1_9ACTN